MGLGLMTEAHTASAGQPDTDTSMGSQSRGGGGEKTPALRSSDLELDSDSSPSPTTTPFEHPSPQATKSTPSRQPANPRPEAGNHPSPLATPNPLATTRQPTSAQPSGPSPKAVGTHAVQFISDEGTTGMPAPQTVADGGIASWPHDDPSRPGWTLDGWFQGDVAYDFSKPVTNDITLKARWGQWATSPTNGP